MADCCSDIDMAGPARGPYPARGRGLISAYRGMTGLVQTWRRRARQRRELQQFEPWLRKDIAACRFDIETEINKPFWRA